MSNLFKDLINLMNFFFRTNFNKEIGIGHIVRILRVYNEFKKKNSCKLFIDKYDNSISHLAPKYFFNELYKGGKFTNEKNDANLFLNKIRAFDKGYIVLDDYRLNIVWQKILSKKNYKIITLDDLDNRYHYSDIIVNYDPKNLNSNNFNLKLNKKKNAKYLLGPKYCILPKIKYSKKKKKNFFSITMYLGGSGDLTLISNLLKPLLNRLKLLQKKVKVNVIIGPLCKNKNKIYKISKKNKNIIPIEKSNNLINIYKNSDLLVASAGSSVFEASIVKLPSILICLSKNQFTDVSYLEKIGHYFFLDYKNIKRELKKLSELIYLNLFFYKRFSNLLNTAELKIDDKGVQRIKNAIFFPKKNNSKNLFNNLTKNSQNKKLVIQRVKDNDINHYLKSRNLKININHSLESSKILPLDHYIWWFKTNRKSYALLKNKKKILYFYEQKIFKFMNKEFYLSGWFACSKDCSIKEILFALNWQRKKRKGIMWLSFIKKNNKLSIYLSKYLGWKKMSLNSVFVKKLKLKFKIKNNNFIFYERNNAI